MQSAVAVTALLLAWTAFQRGSTDEAYFTWSAADAERIGWAAYKQGRVGGLFDMRGLKTERSYNYKLAATWLTPDVVRATARLSQLRSRLSREETQHIVVEAERSGETIVIVEIDPREGSGVIPNEWEAFFQPPTANLFFATAMDSPSSWSGFTTRKGEWSGRCPLSSESLPN